MKTRALLLILMMFGTLNVSFGQHLDKKITLSLQNVTTQEVLEHIGEKYEVSFSFLNNDLSSKRLDVSYTNVPLREILDGLFTENKLEYLEYEGQVIVRKSIKPIEEKPAPQEKPEKPKEEPKEQLQEAQPLVEQIDTIDVSAQKKALVETAKQDDNDDNQIREYPDPDEENFEYYNGVEKLEYFFEKEYEPEDYLHEDTHFGIFYPISTNGMEAGRYVNKFSLHLIAGFSAGVEGFEASLFGNITKDYVNGFQYAGLGNVVGQRLDGVQFAGLGNIVLGESEGVQFAGVGNVIESTFQGVQFAGVGNIVVDTITGFQGAGILNYSERYMEGVQASGLVNVANEKISGGQFAGFINVAEESNGPQIAGFGNFSSYGTVKGLQTAGFINQAYRVNGIQLAGFINVADNIRGFQGAGFINVARNMKGVQLGIINVADSLDGVPIGLFSVVRKNGYFDLEFFYADDFQANAMFKVGAQKFHNIFAFSMQQLAYEEGELNRWALGYGFGSQWGKRTLRLNTDLVAYHVFESNIDDKPFTRDYDLNLLSKFRALGSIHFGSVGIFGGPVFNVMVSQHQDDPESGIIGSGLVTDTFYDKTFDNRTNVKMWIGYNVGIRF